MRTHRIKLTLIPDHSLLNSRRAPSAPPGKPYSKQLRPLLRTVVLCQNKERKNCSQHANYNPSKLKTQLISPLPAPNIISMGRLGKGYLQITFLPLSPLLPLLFRKWKHGNQTLKCDTGNARGLALCIKHAIMPIGGSFSLFPR